MSLNPQNLPLLPGHRYIDPYKQNFHKTQVFEKRSNTFLEKKYYDESQDQDAKDSLTNLTSNFTSDRLKFRETKLNESYPRILPQWAKYDHRVLRFRCYFVEHVVESNHENARLRECELFYYLDDDTIHINEVKTENSGIPQGYFVKRQRIVKDRPGNYVHYSDFNLRSEIMIYGKNFRISDCDEFTKKFYADKNINLNAPEPIPDLDKSAEKFKNINLKENKEIIAELKEYIEVKLKGGHPNKILKQFLDNDRKVLSFDIIWYDSYDKEDKTYKMNYYLADSKIEVREIKVQNSGKDPYPLLLRKSKLPKNPQFTYCPGLETKKELFYAPEDLVLGEHIFIYNRKALIYDCDEFTKKWYKEVLGIDMIPIKMKKNPPNKVFHQIPPYNGYGTEEDSLRSVYELIPLQKETGPTVIIPPRLNNVTGMFKTDKHILRFKAKLISPVSSDAERNFIISYFCRDDTIQVFELAERNSGRLACKFMERQAHQNPFTKLTYKENEFIVGNTIYLKKYVFRLLEMDEYTRKYMIENGHVFRDSDLNSVINRIRSAIKNDNIEEFATELLSFIDPDATGVVTKDNILIGLRKFNVYLSSQELTTLTTNMSCTNNLYSMEELYNLIIS